MLENNVVRWVLGIAVALLLVGLIAYARGDDGDRGRDPRGDSLPTSVVVVS